MKTMSKAKMVAAIATSCLLAVAAPAFAFGAHGGGGGHSGGHASAGGASGFSGGGARGGYSHGGYGRGGGYGYGGGWGYGAAVLGGLGAGYALDSYYDGADDDDYLGGPDQCVGQQQVWDPNAGRYVVQPVPYAC